MQRCRKRGVFGHGVAIVLMRLLCCTNLHKIGSVNILSRVGKGPLEPHCSLRNYWHLMFVGAGSVIFFSEVATGKLPFHQ